MLRHLYIKNYTLIDELDIDFFPGFSVITGETGAGKSIILGALGLLLGNRADVKQIKNGETKCVIEAQFDLEDSALSVFFTVSQFPLLLKATHLLQKLCTRLLLLKDFRLLKNSMQKVKNSIRNIVIAVKLLQLALLLLLRTA